MAERIGFINFSYFDLPSINDFAVNKRISLRLEPHGRVKSLAESHPSLPPMRVEPPQLSKTPDLRQHALPSELQPLMDEYHRHIRMISQERAKIKFVLRRLKEDAKAVFSHYTQVDLLHQWKMNLQFQKIQRHMRLVHSVYLKIAHKKGVETERFMLEHNDKRDLENKIYPALHQLELKLPFRDEIKAPNQLKPVDHDKIRLKDNRQVSVDLKLHIEHLRQNLRLQLAAELKDLQRHTFQDKRQFTLAHLRWQNKLILRAYDKVSKHASQHHKIFQHLLRNAVFKQAEIFPDLFKKALRNPFEIEIRLPNQHDIKTQLQIHTDEVRLEVAQSKIVLEVYREGTALSIEHDKQKSETTKDFLTQTKLERRLVSAAHRWAEHSAESRGYHLLAGRLIPLPIITINSDLKFSVPLALGLHGDPMCQERSSPVPLSLAPKQQRAVWNAIAERELEERRFQEKKLEEAWLDKTRLLRQNLAALDYGERLLNKSQNAKLLASLKTQSSPSSESLGTIEAQVKSQTEPQVKAQAEPQTQLTKKTA